MSSWHLLWWRTSFPPLENSLQSHDQNSPVTAEEKINYLRNFTRGEVQRVVDNFKKRHQDDPETLLWDLWKELETRFGSQAVITNALLERLHKASNFHEREHTKLQEFANLCADVDCQIDNLPGLACLNYPGAIRPIVERLQTNLRTKWEQEVAKHAESHHDAYPSFSVFTRVVKSQSNIKNHPNILAGSFRKESLEVHKERFKDRRTLKTNVGEEKGNHQNPTIPPAQVKKWCPYHNCEGHGLIDCKSFALKSLSGARVSGLVIKSVSNGREARVYKRLSNVITYPEIKGRYLLQK